MGSGLLRELLILEKIGYGGGVYVTDPVVATFLGPKVTAEAPKCVTVDNSQKMQSYNHQMPIHKKRCRQLHTLASHLFASADSYAF